MNDGSHMHLAHPGLSAGPGACTDVLLLYHPENSQPADVKSRDGVIRADERKAHAASGAARRGSAQICPWKMLFLFAEVYPAP